MSVTSLAPKLFGAVSARVKANAGLRSQLSEQFGKREVGEVSVADVFTSGSRVPILYCPTTSVHADRGLLVQVVDPTEKSGLALRSITEFLHFTPEELWLVYLTHEIPPKDLVDEVRGVMLELVRNFPCDMVGFLAGLPKEMPAMAMLSAGLLALSARSDYEMAVAKGAASASEMLNLTLNDALKAMAWMPKLVAAIINKKRGQGFPLASNPVSYQYGMGSQFVQWMGLDRDHKGSGKPRACEWFNLLLNLLSDHEAGNGSAHASAITSSCEASVFAALSSAANALSGRRHGDAAKNALAEIRAFHDKHGGNPTAEHAREHARTVRGQKERMAGMGHGVLNKDVRFEVELQFALKHFPDDPYVKTMALLAREAPPILATPEEVAGGRRPINPNVDFGSGVITSQWIPEPEIGTLVFMLARVLGCTAQAVHNRGLGLPLERQESVTLSDLFRMVGDE